MTHRPGPYRKASASIPEFADAGLDYLVGSPSAHVSVLTHSFTTSTASNALVFQTIFGLDMQDTNYTVLVSNSNGDARGVGYSGKTATGITVVVEGSPSSDVINLVIIGKTTRQP